MFKGDVASRKDRDQSDTTDTYIQGHFSPAILSRRLVVDDLCLWEPWEPAKKEGNGADGSLILLQLRSPNYGNGKWGMK